MTALASMLHVLLALAMCPLLVGVISRTKAKFAGRRGQPLLQLYHDLVKLLRKGAVYSRTTTWVFRAGPIVGLSAVLVAIGIVPLGAVPALGRFPGDVILLVYALGLMRFMTVLGALDTGSAFEGMGASREVQFSLLGELVLLLSLASLVACTRSIGLSDIFASLQTLDSSRWIPAASLAGAALFVVLLVENARIPIDDSCTHLELTMIHEVMVLDHGGVDLGLIQYGAALKLWVFSSLVVGVVMPWRTGHPILDLLGSVGAVFVLGVLVGVVESTMARLRLVRVPQMLSAAGVLAIIAIIWALR